MPGTSRFLLSLPTQVKWRRSRHDRARNRGGNEHCAASRQRL